MKRVITLVLAAMMTISGCSSSSKKESITFPQIVDTLTTFMPEDKTMQEGQSVLNLLTIDGEVKNAQAFFSDKEPEKVLIVVEANDEDSALEISENMHYYVNSLKKSAAMYNPEQVKTIENAYISVKDTFAVLIITDDPDGAKKALAGMNW